MPLGSLQWQTDFFGRNHQPTGAFADPSKPLCDTVPFGDQCRWLWRRVVRRSAGAGALPRCDAAVWSDPNLRSLTRHVKSGLFLAHVRASTGTATSRNNCHPFVHDAWSFMHNGQVGGYDQFRRDADMMIPDSLYPARRGATDSEALFLGG